MAEAFGVAAGVFGVVSMSIQLAESVQKVRSFRANFKQACPRLADLVEEIDETYDLMKELEHQTQNTGAVPTLLMCRCINSSRRAVEYFAQVTSELEIYANRRKIRGGIKFALSQDEIARMLSRMERAKGLLVLAYVQHLRVVQQQQYDVMIQGIERLTSGQDDILQRMRPAAVDQQPVCTNGAVAKTDRKNFRRIFEVRTPEWMNDKIWQLARQIDLRMAFHHAHIWCCYTKRPDHQSLPGWQYCCHAATVRHWSCIAIRPDLRRV